MSANRTSEIVHQEVSLFSRPHDTRLTQSLPRYCFCLPFVRPFDRLRGASGRAAALRQAPLRQAQEPKPRYFSAFVVRFFARRAKKRTTTKMSKYHAAVYPEPACPELVEGSKGRLYHDVGQQPNQQKDNCYEAPNTQRGVGISPGWRQ